jgi:predicted RNA-binding Zn ribbon-like protein
LLTVTVALGALVLAGCGADRLSKQEYEQEVRSTYAGVQEAFLGLRVDSLEQLAPRLDDAQAALRTAADELEAIEPPAEVVEHNEQIVEGLREYADDLDEARAAARRGDASALEEFNLAIADNPAIAKIAEAAEEMKFMGYDLGPIAEE